MGIKAEIGDDGKVCYWDTNTGEAWTLKNDEVRDNGD